MVNFTRCICSVPEEMTPKDLDNLLRVSKGIIDFFFFLHKLLYIGEFLSVTLDLVSNRSGWISSRLDKLNFILMLVITHTHTQRQRG